MAARHKTHHTTSVNNNSNMRFLVAFLAISLNLLTTLLASPACPSGVPTACGANSTCCPVLFSGTGYGCCNLGPDAVCCGQQGCCPAGWTCVNTPPYSSACVKDGKQIPGTQVCEPGAQFPANHSSLPSIMVIGDSVSIGYTPQVASILANKAFVQHNPWSGGGGADDVGTGLECFESYTRDSMFEDQRWTLVSFNFGLHNLDNSTSAEELYGQLLSNFTDKLLEKGSRLGWKQIVYVLTTPYMPDRYLGNMVVEDLNRIATGIMQERNIPIADLYTRVTDLCGQVYKNCSICDNEYNPQTGIYCGYHYTSAGWTYLAEYLAPFYSKYL